MTPSETDIKAAHVVYGGPFNAKVHEPARAEMPSWTAHILLVKVFRFTEADASSTVNCLIRDASMSYPRKVASTVFASHGGKREWTVTARFAPFVQGSIFSIRERERA